MSHPDTERPALAAAKISAALGFALSGGYEPGCRCGDCEGLRTHLSALASALPGLLAASAELDALNDALFRDVGEACGERDQGWSCTRSKGHSGVHIASGFASIYARWASANDSGLLGDTPA